MNFWKRNLMRLLYLPAALGIRINKFLRNRLEISNVEMLIMNPCNPSCEDCRNLNSFACEHVDYDVDQLIRDVDDFLGNVDRIYRFIITGGDTLLYRELNKLLNHLIGQEKIDLINVFTDASVNPCQDILELMKNRKVMVTVSSYPEEASPNKTSFTDTLGKNNINYLVKNTWRDLGRFNPVANNGETDLKNRFARCISKNYHVLNNGEYNICLRSAHGKQLGQFSPGVSDSVIFRDRKDYPAFKEEMRKLFHKKHIAACGKCRGSHRETALDDFLEKALGNWYKENIYYKYRIHRMPVWKSNLARYVFLPLGLWHGFTKSLLNRFEQAHVEMPITTRCNFRCRDCSNLIPFYKNPADFDLNILIRDIDDFLSHVDRIYRFIIMGGETFLYRDLDKLISYMISQRKINLIHIFTNGSIIPEPKMIKLLKSRKVLVSISGFPVEVSPNKLRFIAAMEKNNINHNVEEKLWRDLGGFNPAVDDSVEAMKNRLANCYNKGCHNLSNGEYHICPRSVNGQALGQFKPDDADKVIIRGRKDHQAVRKELQSLRNKEYVKACGKCSGMLIENIIPGVQMSRKTLE
jgi:MoaA/NifB/PqqE/SkfB family radical SAM enzyme